MKCASHACYLVRAERLPSDELLAAAEACTNCTQVWDTASGQLKLTLTGHIEQVNIVDTPRTLGAALLPFKQHHTRRAHQLSPKYPHATGMMHSKNTSLTACAVSTFIH